MSKSRRTTMGFSPTSSAKAKVSTKATPVKSEGSAGKGSRPTFNLKVKVGNETKPLTGLWDQVSKKGVNYLSGKDKETNVRYMVFDSKVTKGAKELSFKEDGGELQRICTLESKEGKNGTFLTGKDSDGNAYFLFENNPKPE